MHGMVMRHCSEGNGRIKAILMKLLVFGDLKLMLYFSVCCPDSIQHFVYAMKSPPAAPNIKRGGGILLSKPISATQKKVIPIPQITMC